MAKVVIIGGGVSGLSAGIYARMNGHYAVVCEKHFEVGGNLTGWQRGEYHIDNCIHWLTGTNTSTDMYRMWTELGALGSGIDIYYGDKLYTYELYGQQISLFRDLERTRRAMLDTSPSDRRETECLIRAVRLVQEISGVAVSGYERRLNLLERLRTLPTLVKYFNLSTGDLACRFRNHALRGFITAFLGRDFSSLALIMIFATFCGNNGGIPVGGSRAMAAGMADRLLSLGGELYLKKEAAKINFDGSRAVSVSFTDGIVLEADYVILATDPMPAFGQLLGRDMPRKLMAQYNDSRMKRFSAYQCAFACDTDMLPFEADYIFDVPIDKRAVLHTDKLIVREFSHEPTFSPKGKNIIQTLTFCDEWLSSELIGLREDRAAYEKMKQELSCTVKDLIEHHFPSLNGRIKCIDAWTPATYKRYTGSATGSFMSFAVPPKRLLRRISPRIDGIENVFFATQWQQAPGGLPIAAECGKSAVREVVLTEAKRSVSMKECNGIKSNY